MDSAFLRKHKLALICAAGVVVIGGCFVIYQATKMQRMLDAEIKPLRSRQDSTEDAKQMASQLLGTDIDVEEHLRLAKETDAILDYQDDKKESYWIDKSKVKFPVQVFVRLRPLIGQEIEAKDEEIEYETKYGKKSKSHLLNIVDITKKTRRSAIKKKKKKEEAPKYKKFKGFQNVLIGTDDNQQCFQRCIEPSIDNIFNGYTVCSFAYGHTGSGKTHTILGYDNKGQAGMYRLTAKYICQKLKILNSNIKNEENEILVSCRFAELYQGKMRDLFGNLVQCAVREDEKGNINIRGPTLKDEETGEVKVQPLTPIYIGSDDVDKLIVKVSESLKMRKQGSSAIHDESSRSHVFLEMELVTNRLIKGRMDLWRAEGEIVPVGKARDDQLILIQSGQFEQDPQTGKYRIIENWKPNPKDQDKLIEIQKEFDILDKNVKQCEANIDRIMNESDECIGGNIIFVDLAGNEWGSDSKNIKGDNNIQASERKEINKSLLSLKECVRALHNHKEHVPYRDSKLTMVLRPHLRGINSTAIMIANISPSKNHIQKTFNTLQYSQMVANA